MQFPEKFFVAIIGAIAFSLLSCEKNKKTDSEARKEILPGSAALSFKFGDTEHLSTDELVQKIVKCDIRQGYTSEYEKAALELIDKDPKLALLTLYNTDTVSSRIGFSALCKKLAASNPEILIDWLRKDLPRFTSDQGVSGQYWSNMLRELAVFDSEKALDLLQSSGLKETEQRGAVLSMFYALSMSDQNKALEMIKSLPEGLRAKGYEGIGYSLAAHEPAKALQVAALIGNSSDRARLSEQIFAEWLKRKPEEALKEVEQLDPRQFEKLGVIGAEGENSFIKLLAEKKPEALHKFLLHLTPGVGNKKLFESSLRALADSNFEAALNLVSDLPAGQFQNELAELTFASGVKPEDVANYARMTESLEGDAKISAIEGIGRTISKSSIEEIMKISASLDDSNKSKFLLSAFTNSNPDRLDELMEKITSQFFQGNLTTEDSKNLTQDVAGRLVVANSERALTWYEQLPQDQRVSAMKGIAHELARDDIVRLGDWLNTKERNEEWAIGASIIVQHLNYSDSQAAAVWKKALADSSEQRPQQ